MNQDNMLLQYLKENKKIDYIQALNEIGIARLSACIHRLRRGHNIETKMKTVINRYDKRVSVADYILREEV